MEVKSSVVARVNLDRANCLKEIVHVVVKRTTDGVQIELKSDQTKRTIELTDVVVDIDRYKRVCGIELLFVRSQLKKANINTDRFIEFINKLAHVSYDDDADSVIIKIGNRDSREQPLVEARIDLNHLDEPIAITIPVDSVVADATTSSF